MQFSFAPRSLPPVHIHFVIALWSAKEPESATTRENTFGYGNPGTTGDGPLVGQKHSPPLIGTGGLVTLATFFLSKRSEHEKIQPQQITVTVNLSDLLRANLAAAQTAAPVRVQSSLDSDADRDALASLEGRKTGSSFTLPDNAPAWLKIALKEVGQRRTSDKKNSPRIIEYLRAADLPEDTNDITTVPWSDL